MNKLWAAATITRTQRTKKERLCLHRALKTTENSWIWWCYEIYTVLMLSEPWLCQWNEYRFAVNTHQEITSWSLARVNWITGKKSFFPVFRSIRQEKASWVSIHQPNQFNSRPTTHIYIFAPAGFWPRGQNPRRHPRSPRVYTFKEFQNLRK